MQRCTAGEEERLQLQPRPPKPLGRRGRRRKKAVPAICSAISSPQACPGAASVIAEARVQRPVSVPGATRFDSELEEGNTEYKWKLIRPSRDRLTHLTTQLNWRLNESQTKGEAVYLIGVRDDGVADGISEKDLEESMQTLETMAQGVQASIESTKVSPGLSGQVAKVLLRRNESRSAGPLELRIAVLGCAGSGKSTLVGVLTKGSLDNGRGLARMQVFRHNHEVENGRTSCVSQHIMGFRHDGHIANYSTGGRDASPLSAQEIQQQSAKVISFVDLAGHAKYLKTTLSGIIGLSPDYAMLGIAASHGGPELGGSTALEHLDIALALDVPFFLVITKTDATDAETLATTMQTVKAMMRLTGRETVLIEEMADLSRLDRQRGQEVVEEENFSEEEEGGSRGGQEDSGSHRGLVPVFSVSSVTGAGLDLLRCFIRSLPRSRSWDDVCHEPAEVHIDSSFFVEGVGTVLAGNITRGKVEVGQKLLLGPDRVTGAFQSVLIRSIHINRLPVRHAAAGQCITLAYRPSPAAPAYDASVPDCALVSSPVGSSLHIPVALADCQHAVDKFVKPDEEEERFSSSPRKSFKGTVLISPTTSPVAAYEFEAEVVILSDAQGPIVLNQQVVLHMHTMRQTARILSLQPVVPSAGQPMLAGSTCKGQTVLCTFRFLFHPAYISRGMTLFLRWGRTLGIGRVVSVAVPLVAEPDG